MTELKPQEGEAIMRGWAQYFGAKETDTLIVQPDFKAGWLAAKDFYVGRGYTPRSMLRAQAFTKGHCPICGADTAMPTEGRHEGAD